MDDLELVKQFFNTKSKEHGHSLKALDWGSKRTQEIRFFILSEIAPLNNTSILDIGCGFADFFYFLKDKLGLNIEYTGIDISSQIVQTTKKLYPQLTILQGDILKDAMQPHDYVFGSGIHNIRVQNNYELFEKVLQKMFTLANHGVATNLLNSAYKEPLAEHIFAYDVQKVYKIIKQITPYTSIREDYLSHDFTLYLYKNDWAKRSAYEEK